MIVKRDSGYHVVSEKGKNLGGPYKSHGQAKKRLAQVEYFKNKDASGTQRRPFGVKRIPRDPHQLYQHPINVLGKMIDRAGTAFTAALDADLERRAREAGFRSHKERISVGLQPLVNKAMHKNIWTPRRINYLMQVKGQMDELVRQGKRNHPKYQQLLDHFEDVRRSLEQ
jgi:hypothetical protein